MKTLQELQTAAATLEADLEAIDWDNGSYGETGEMIGTLDTLKWVLGLEESTWLDALARGKRQYEGDAAEEDDEIPDFRPGIH